MERRTVWVWFDLRSRGSGGAFGAYRNAMGIRRRLGGELGPSAQAQNWERLCNTYAYSTAYPQTHLTRLIPLHQRHLPKKIEEEEKGGAKRMPVCKEKS